MTCRPQHGTRRVNDMRQPSNRQHAGWDRDWGGREVLPGQCRQQAPSTGSTCRAYVRSSCANALSAARGTKTPGSVVHLYVALRELRGERCVVHLYARASHSAMELPRFLAIVRRMEHRQAPQQHEYILDVSHDQPPQPPPNISAFAQESRESDVHVPRPRWANGEPGVWRRCCRDAPRAALPPPR